MCFRDEELNEWWLKEERTRRKRTTEWCVGQKRRTLQARLATTRVSDGDGGRVGVCRQAQPGEFRCRATNSMGNDPGEEVEEEVTGTEGVEEVRGADERA